MVWFKWMGGILHVYGTMKKSACPPVQAMAKLRSIEALISMLNLKVGGYIHSIAVSQSHEGRGITNHLNWIRHNGSLTSLPVNAIVVHKGLDCKPERLSQEVVTLFDEELRGW